MKQRGSIRTTYWVGPFLAVLVLIGIVLLGSGRLRGCYPFLARRDRPYQAGPDPLHVMSSSQSRPAAPPEDAAGRNGHVAQAPRKSADLARIDGISPEHAQKLKSHGLRSTDDLLLAGANPEGREDLAAVTDLSGTMILRWVNQADLFRIKGVGSEYAGLLEAAGVDNVPELAQQDADALTKRMTALNREKTLVRRNPADAQVAAWIEIAKSLPRVVVY